MNHLKCQDLEQKEPTKVCDSARLLLHKIKTVIYNVIIVVVYEAFTLHYSQTSLRRGLSALRDISIKQHVNCNSMAFCSA